MARHVDLNLSVAVEAQARRAVTELRAGADAEPAMFHLPGVIAAERTLASRDYTRALSQVEGQRRVEALRRGRSRPHMR